VAAEIQFGGQSMWTLIVTTFVFAGSVAGGVAANTAFLDFPDEGNAGRPQQRWAL
jgi:hypothetical protein